MAISLSLKVDSIYIKSDGHAEFDNDSYPVLDSINLSVFDCICWR